MKKNLLLAFAAFISVIMTSCGKDDTPIDPMVGLWQLDNVNIDAEGSEFDYIDAPGLTSLMGETLHTIEFNADFTYERILSVSLSNGTMGDIDETGEWETNNDNLSLDTGAGQIIGLPYSLTVVSVTETDLILSYAIAREYFPQSKIDEWLADGTIDANGFFTVSEAEEDSIFANYLEVVPIAYTLEFEK